MNNDTTTHNTTRHYYMGGYSLGSHLWNAGESYMDKAESMVRAGAKGFAGQFLRQAEEAYAWANALQAGTFVEVGEDMVGVEVDSLDAWVAPERVEYLRGAIAMLGVVDSSVDLPSSPSRDGGPEGSPENVSRETYACTVQVSTPPPSAPAPSAYDEVMETYTTPATTISDLLAQIVSLIMTQVSSQMEDIAEAVYDAKDIAEDVMESYEFTSAVESILSDWDISDKVQEAVADLTFTVSVD